MNGACAIRRPGNIWGPHMIHDLNRLVLSMAPLFDARPLAPATLGELMSLDGPLVVWDGASDQTIYCDARVNHAFRAWHDAAHIAGRFPFTLEGERAACEYQIREARTMFPRLPESLAAAICAEVIGQAEHFATYGMFPANQAQFHSEYQS